MPYKKIISNLSKNFNKKHMIEKENLRKPQVAKKDYKAQTKKKGPNNYAGQGGSRGSIDL